MTQLKIKFDDGISKDKITLATFVYECLKEHGLNVEYAYFAYNDRAIVSIDLSDEDLKLMQHWIVMRP